MCACPRICEIGVFQTGNVLVLNPKPQTLNPVKEPVFSCLELLQTSTVLVIFGDLHPSNSELLCVNAYPVTCDPVRIMLTYADVC
jgi:hypothetical protein